MSKRVFYAITLSIAVLFGFTENRLTDFRRDAGAFPGWWNTVEAYAAEADEPEDRFPEEEALEEKASEEGASKDGALEEGASKDGALEEGASKDRASEEGASKDEVPKQETPEEGAPNTNTSGEDTPNASGPEADVQHADEEVQADAPLVEAEVRPDIPLADAETRPDVPPEPAGDISNIDMAIPDSNEGEEAKAPVEPVAIADTASTPAPSEEHSDPASIAAAPDQPIQKKPLMSKSPSKPQMLQSALQQPQEPAVQPQQQQQAAQPLQQQQSQATQPLQQPTDPQDSDLQAEDPFTLTLSNRIYGETLDSVDTDATFELSIDQAALPQCPAGWTEDEAGYYTHSVTVKNGESKDVSGIPAGCSVMLMPPSAENSFGDGAEQHTYTSSLIIDDSYQGDIYSMPEFNHDKTLPRTSDCTLMRVLNDAGTLKPLRLINDSEIELPLSVKITTPGNWVFRLSGASSKTSSETASETASSPGSGTVNLQEDTPGVVTLPAKSSGCIRLTESDAAQAIFGAVIKPLMENVTAVISSLENASFNQETSELVCSEETLKDGAYALFRAEIKEDTPPKEPEKTDPPEEDEPESGKEKEKETESEKKETESEAAKQTEPEKPKETEPEKPGDTESEKPAETESGKPKETEHEKPKETESGKQEETEPDQTVATKTVLPDETAPDKNMEPIGLRPETGFPEGTRTTEHNGTESEGVLTEKEMQPAASPEDEASQEKAPAANPDNKTAQRKAPAKTSPPRKSRQTSAPSVPSRRTPHSKDDPQRVPKTGITPRKTYRSPVFPEDATKKARTAPVPTGDETPFAKTGALAAGAFATILILAALRRRLRRQRGRQGKPRKS